MTASGLVDVALVDAAQVVLVPLGLLYLACRLLFGARTQPEPAQPLTFDRNWATAAAILQPDTPLLDDVQVAQLHAHQVPDVAAEAAAYLRAHTTSEES